MMLLVWVVSGKTLLFELHFEGKHCDLIEMEKGVSIKGNDISKARSTRVYKTWQSSMWLKGVCLEHTALLPQSKERKDLSDIIYRQKKPSQASELESMTRLILKKVIMKDDNIRRESDGQH